MLAGSPRRTPKPNISGIIFFEVPSSGFDESHLQRMTYLYPETALSDLKVGSSLISSLHAAFGRVVGDMPVVTCISSSGVTVRDQVSGLQVDSIDLLADVNDVIAPLDCHAIIHLYRRLFHICEAQTGRTVRSIPCCHARACRDVGQLCDIQCLKEERCPINCEHWKESRWHIWTEHK